MRRFFLTVIQNLHYSAVRPSVRGLPEIKAKLQATEPDRTGFESRVYHLPDEEPSL